MHCPAGHRMAMSREGGAWLDVSRFCADGFDPVLNRLSDELWAIVGPDVSRHAAQDEQVAQGINDVPLVQLSLYLDRQIFPV